MSNFQDFEILINAEGDKYFAQVVRSPAGESDRCPLKLPFDQDQILLRLENAILRSVAPMRSRRVEAADMRAIGEGLFRALLTETDEIRLLYSNSRNSLPAGEGLRVKLRIDAERLGALPWEYFYDDIVVKDYLGLDAHTSVVRYIAMSRPIPQLAIHGQLRILGMAANPRDDDDDLVLNVTKERSKIDRAISGLHKRGVVDFQWVAGESYDDLFNAAAYKGPWHVFHFIGHGGVDTRSEGFVELAGESGEPKAYSASQLVRVLRSMDFLRLVVLNCCDSGRGSSSVANKLVHAGVPAVLAMQFPISDDAAIELASAFYLAIANGQPVDAAVTHARIRMEAKSSIEWGIPVLYMRTSDGRIFARPIAAKEQPLNGQGGLALATPIAAVLNAQTQALLAGQGTGKSELPGGNGDDIFSALAEQAEEILTDSEMSFFAEDTLESLEVSQLESLIEVGKSLLNNKKHDGSVQARTAKMYFELGKRYQKQNSMNKAFVNFSNAIELNVDEPEYLCARANVFTRSEQYDLATVDINKAIEMVPQRADYHWIKGVILLLAARNPAHLDQLGRAVKSLSTAIDIDATVGKYYSARAAANMRMDKLKESLEDLNKAISLEPGDGKSYYNRAHLRLRLRDRVGALQDLEAAAANGYVEAINDIRQLKENGAPKL